VTEELAKAVSVLTRAFQEFSIQVIQDRSRFVCGECEDRNSDLNDKPLDIVEFNLISHDHEGHQPGEVVDYDPHSK
jgi:hypothetical protein